MEKQDLKPVLEGTVLVVHNRHHQGCGKPPDLIAGAYTGYFENILGEQFVFTYDIEKDEGHLWGGDLGWENPVKVVDGSTPDNVLSPEEQAWLKLVWGVAKKQ